MMRQRAEQLELWPGLFPRRAYEDEIKFIRISEEDGIPDTFFDKDKIQVSPIYEPIKWRD